MQLNIISMSSGRVHIHVVLSISAGVDCVFFIFIRLREDVILSFRVNMAIVKTPASMLCFTLSPDLADATT